MTPVDVKHNLQANSKYDSGEEKLRMPRWGNIQLLTSTLRNEIGRHGFTRALQARKYWALAREPRAAMLAGRLRLMKVQGAR